MHKPLNEESNTNEKVYKVKGPVTKIPTIPIPGIAPIPSHPYDIPISIKSNERKSASKSTKSKPGICYIFNQEDFDDRKHGINGVNILQRLGSSEDVNILCKTLNTFNVNLKVFKSPTVKRLKTIVKGFETIDFSQYSFVIIVILSHGARNDIIYARDAKYSIDDDILNPLLRNATLQGKPKIFIIQACKDKLLPTSSASTDSEALGSFLKCYSTFEGYPSFRSTDGTLFIRSLCYHLLKDGLTKDIRVIMRDVTADVRARANLLLGVKQIPVITANMSKPFVFGDYM